MVNTSQRTQCNTYTY